ncbi:MAG TPA: hypothetical protein DIW52_24580, partial [Pseudomonas sp.]|nr:hypothetical protein [Pseudomonas sp.]
MGDARLEAAFAGKPRSYRPPSLASQLLQAIRRLVGPGLPATQFCSKLRTSSPATTLDQQTGQH